MDDSIVYEKEKAVDAIINTLKACEIDYETDDCFVSFQKTETGKYAFRLYKPALEETRIRLTFRGSRIMVTLEKPDICFVFDDKEAYLLL